VSCGWSSLVTETLGWRGHKSMLGIALPYNATSASASTSSPHMQSPLGDIVEEDPSQMSDEQLMEAFGCNPLDSKCGTKSKAPPSFGSSSLAGNSDVFALLHGGSSGNSTCTTASASVSPPRTQAPRAHSVSSGPAFVPQVRSFQRKSLGPKVQRSQSSPAMFTSSSQNNVVNGIFAKLESGELDRTPPGLRRARSMQLRRTQSWNLGVRQEGTALPSAAPMSVCGSTVSSPNRNNSFCGGLTGIREDSSCFGMMGGAAGQAVGMAHGQAASNIPVIGSCFSGQAPVFGACATQPTFCAGMQQNHVAAPAVPKAKAPPRFGGGGNFGGGGMDALFSLLRR